MKIIQIISSLGNGGAEKLVVELSNELAKQHEVILVSLKEVEHWMFPPKYLSSRVEIISLNKGQGKDIKLIYKLFFLLSRSKPDIVHIHLNMPLFYMLLIMPFLRKIKFVFTIHNSFLPHKELINKVSLLPFYKRVANICLSDSIRSQFSSGFPKLSFTTIENGIKKNERVFNDLVYNEVRESSKGFKYTFLFVGRFSYQKNIPLLLSLFTSSELKNIKLLIIGDGCKEDKVQVNTSSKDTYNRIQYLGKKDNVIDYMKCVDSLILTSRYEGIPIVVLEALSVGLPILSTQAGGISDILKDGVNGFLSVNSSKKELIECIDKFCTLNTEQINTMKRNNMSLFDKSYGISSCANKHLKLYSKILD